MSDVYEFIYICWLSWAVLHKKYAPHSNLNFRKNDSDENKLDWTHMEVTGKSIKN